MTTDCVFCEIIAGRAPSRPIYEDDHTLAFLDIAPITPGHTLVIPKTHSVDLHDIAPDDLAAVAVSARQVAGLLTERLGADGVNLANACGVAAWQTVFHFHMHVLPRFTGDHPIPAFDRSATPADLDAMHARITTP